MAGGMGPSGGGSPRETLAERVANTRAREADRKDGWRRQGSRDGGSPWHASQRASVLDRTSPGATHAGRAASTAQALLV